MILKYGRIAENGSSNQSQPATHLDGAGAHKVDGLGVSLLALGAVVGDHLADGHGVGHHVAHQALQTKPSRGKVIVMTILIIILELETKLREVLSFKITERATTRAFSWMKVATTTFTITCY